MYVLRLPPESLKWYLRFAITGNEADPLLGVFGSPTEDTILPE